jgi:orotate phosphoribosyltransferase
MNYRSVVDLSDQVFRWIGTLPRDIDVIVGVPRSGLLVANLLALHLNLPLTDVEGLLEGRVFQGGARLRNKQTTNLLSAKCNVLVVDDSVCTGRQIQIVKEQVAAADLPHVVYYAAVYVKPGAEESVDFFCEVLPIPRCFEWNLMHRKGLLSVSCMEIDGVLRQDPNDYENNYENNGTNCTNFFECVDSWCTPSETVGWLVTCRSEKYRALTEAWLTRHGVKYKELIMNNHTDQAAQQSVNAYSSYKANIYVKTKARLFIESSLKQAIDVANLSGKAVFCLDTREMVYPDVQPKSPYKVRELQRVITTIKAKSHGKLRKLLGVQYRGLKTAFKNFYDAETKKTAKPALESCERDLLRNTLRTRC